MRRRARDLLEVFLGGPRRGMQRRGARLGSRRFGPEVTPYRTACCDRGDDRSNHAKPCRPRSHIRNLARLNHVDTIYRCSVQNGVIGGILQDPLSRGSTRRGSCPRSAPTSYPWQPRRRRRRVFSRPFRSDRSGALRSRRRQRQRRHGKRWFAIFARMGVGIIRRTRRSAIQSHWRMRQHGISLIALVGTNGTRDGTRKRHRRA